MNSLKTNNEYGNWLESLKEKIKQSQIKASLSVNSELIRLYWNLGLQIIEKQENSKWGSGFLVQLSKDLQREFPTVTGFSKRNLELIRQWVQFYSSNNNDFAKQLVSQTETDHSIAKQVVSQLQNTGNQYFNRFFQIPWGHHILIIQKIKENSEALFYINETIENGWSRAVLEYQIESNLLKRKGSAITNFKTTLPLHESDLAQQILKDPYNFEFLSLSEKAKEHDLEQKLVENITQFLLELGKGFAYLGRQSSIKVGKKEYRTDLLFYHIHLKAYIIIELKMKEFEPEFIGKLNFYISAIDQLIKRPDDNSTIGILLCKNKDNFEVEFALKDVNKPIGVSEFTYKELPGQIKQALPSAEELKNELKKIANE